MSADTIDCPVAWCAGDEYGHRQDPAFHMSDKISGPMFVIAHLTQIEGEAVKLEIEAEYAGSETSAELRDFAAEATACAAWLLEQADKLDQLNGVSN